jgi:hypothetical protein
MSNEEEATPAGIWSLLMHQYITDHCKPKETQMDTVETTRKETTAILQATRELTQRTLEKEIEARNAEANARIAVANYTIREYATMHGEPIKLKGLPVVSEEEVKHMAAYYMNSDELEADFRTEEIFGRLANYYGHPKWAEWCNEK